MTVSSTRKLSKEGRREQLLETAQLIAREEGTDALTLGHLAQRAGVSKPVAYEHFRTRAGLMIALYKQINDRQMRLQEEALANTPARLADVAEVLSAAYMACYTAVGPEWHAIAAALQGHSEMAKYQQDMIDGHIDSYCSALAPFSELAPAELRRRCVGIIGAAGAISSDMVRGRIDEATAAQDLKSLILNWIASC